MSSCVISLLPDHSQHSTEFLETFFLLGWDPEDEYLLLLCLSHGDIREKRYKLGVSPSIFARKLFRIQKEILK
jgi:hypothetical protein